MTKLFPAVLLLIFTACQGNYEPNTKSVGEEPASSPTKIKKVVSLCNTASETLFSLGLSHRVIGVDITSNTPTAKTVSEIGTSYRFHQCRRVELEVYSSVRTIKEMAS